MRNIDDGHGNRRFLSQSTNVGGVLDSSLQGETFFAFEVVVKDLDKRRQIIRDRLSYSLGRNVSLPSFRIPKTKGQGRILEHIHKAAWRVDVSEIGVISL